MSEIPWLAFYVNKWYNCKFLLREVDDGVGKGVSTVLYCHVLYCAVLYCTVLCCTVLCYAVLYCTLLYCTVLYCTVL